MKVCILGYGLTSLTLAKALVNQGLKVDVFFKDYNFIQNKSRTLGISKSNIEFFNENILNIEKLLWDIKKIEIYSENLNSESILNFKNNNQKLFSIIKNYKLNNLLLSNLKKNKLFNLKKQISYNDLVKKNYKLIINSDPSSEISKKFFYKKIKKNYYSNAFITIIKHKKIKNDTAIQIFTSVGPLAFLPISETKTSIVYSVRGKEQIDLFNLINKYNNKYEILNIAKPSKFKINSLNLRSYYFKNILAFGDLLHKLHPLAGQGFNMSLRDIKEILNLIKSRINNGLDLDNSVCADFEKKTRHKNYIFSQGIDFVYEFFKFETKIQNNFLSKSLKSLGKNKTFNKLFTKFADNGIII